MALSLEQYVHELLKGGEIKEILIERLEREKELSMGVFVKEGDHLPKHLLIEILSRLPIRSLLQFKTVCKLWHSIIKSSHFISMRLKNYYNNDSNGRDCLIVQYGEGHEKELMTYELLVDDTTNKVLSYQEIDMPLYSADICGPCDGLYLLARPGLGNSLWNPTLNEYKRLPEIGRPDLPSYLHISRESYGFGFDYKTKDYKVILIREYYNKRDYEDSGIFLKYPPSLFVYSLKSDSWRYWGDLKKTYHIERNKSYLFVNSCYYWLGARDFYCNDYEVVISFDITADTYEEISLPKFKKKPYCGSQLIVHHGCISFACVSEKWENFSVWAWNENIWTQTFTIDVGFDVWGVFSHWRDNMLLCRRAFGNLFLCDTNTAEIWMLDDPRVIVCVESIIFYKESLVSIMEFSSASHHEVDH